MDIYSSVLASSSSFGRQHDYSADSLYCSIADLKQLLTQESLLKDLSPPATDNTKILKAMHTCGN